MTIHNSTSSSQSNQLDPSSVWLSALLVLTRARTGALPELAKLGFTGICFDREKTKVGAEGGFIKVHLSTNRERKHEVWVKVCSEGGEVFSDETISNLIIGQAKVICTDVVEQVILEMRRITNRNISSAIDTESGQSKEYTVKILLLDEQIDSPQDRGKFLGLILNAKDIPGNSNEDLVRALLQRIAAKLGCEEKLGTDWKVG